jgi:hypothetical protein
MEQVELGVLLPGAQVINDLNINPTWKAHVKTNQTTLVAYVKQVDLRGIYVECVCAVLGRCLGLPIPKPLIVRAANDALNHIPESETILLFGSEDAVYPSFRRYLTNNSDDAMKKLENFPKALDIGVFDEWIANADRNAGNILYDGGDNFSFIDHEKAINPDLKPEDAAATNEIVRVIFAAQSEFEKYKTNRNVQTEIIPHYKTLPCALLSEKTFASSYLNETEILSVIEFLSKRLDNIEMLFEDRLCFRQKKMSL